MANVVGPPYCHTHWPPLLADHRERVNQGDPAMDLLLFSDGSKREKEEEDTNKKKFFFIEIQGLFHSDLQDLLTIARPASYGVAGGQKDPNHCQDLATF